MAKVSARAKEFCPVSDPDLGLISENDHRVGLCICRFCTCSEHICPSVMPREPYLKSTLYSKYQDEYKKKPFDSNLCPSGRRYYPNTQRMELKTTAGNDYTLKELPKRVKKEERPSPVKTRLNNITSKGNDYPNWGITGSLIEKTWHPPVRSTEIPFYGSSSYRDNYTTASVSTLGFSMDNYSGFSANLDTIPLGTSGVWDKKTTYKSSMKDFSRQQLSQRVRVKAVRRHSMEIHSRHFSCFSTNQGCSS